MIKIFTIGIYGFTENAFFNALIKNKIDTFIDIRRRRGVRGSEYKFANSNYLQNKLKTLNIFYIHFIELAPTAETRKKQMKIDLLTKTKKRKRIRLSQEFIESYKYLTLNFFDVEKFFSCLNKNAKNIVLFCVERNPEACHRSIVTDYIKNRYHDISIHHIL